MNDRTISRDYNGVTGETIPQLTDDQIRGLYYGTYGKRVRNLHTLEQKQRVAEKIWQNDRSETRFWVKYATFGVYKPVFRVRGQEVCGPLAQAIEVADWLAVYAPDYEKDRYEKDTVAKIYGATFKGQMYISVDIDNAIQAMTWFLGKNKDVVANYLEQGEAVLYEAISGPGVGQDDKFKAAQWMVENGTSLERRAVAWTYLTANSLGYECTR